MKLNLLILLIVILIVKDISCHKLKYKSSSLFNSNKFCNLEEKDSKIDQKVEAKVEIKNNNDTKEISVKKEKVEKSSKISKKDNKKNNKEFKNNNITAINQNNANHRSIAQQAQHLNSSPLYSNENINIIEKRTLNGRENNRMIDNTELPRKLDLNEQKLMNQSII